VSEHQWENGEVIAVGFIGGLNVHTLHRERHCKVCGQGDIVPVEPGYAGGFCVGMYSRWDGVSTCEDVIIERHKSDTRHKAEHEAWLRQLEAERPRRQAFVDELNALCAKHGCHLGAGDYDGDTVVVLKPQTYELCADGVTVT
jgi:hypothetical protein